MVTGWPVLTMVRGKTVVENGKVVGTKAHGVHHDPWPVDEDRQLARNLRHGGSNGIAIACGSGSRQSLTTRPDHQERPMSKHHHLAASAKHCHWGFFDAARPSMLTVQSGDTVTIDTLTGASRDGALRHRFIRRRNCLTSTSTANALPGRPIS